MSSLLDDQVMQFVMSPSMKLHVKSWFGETVCGRVFEGNWEWRLGALTSLRSIARMSQQPKPNNLCGLCAKVYKDVNIREEA